LDRFGRSTGGASSSLNMMMLPCHCSRRNFSAAANPAAPPPTITILSGDPAAGAMPRLACDSGVSFLVRTKILPSRCSRFQHATGLKAGACKASPVRRLKQAWCHGHRTVSSTISPSASGPP
jgi:hypothetical protein